MGSIWLVRHARSTANADGILSGRLPGIDLDDTGREQLEGLRNEARKLAFDVIVSSPLERTQQTAQAFRDVSTARFHLDDRLIECDYGTWSGRKLEDLTKESLWPEIQKRPSAVTFPSGEAMLAMRDRAVASVEFWKEESACAILVSHGDVIKSIVAHYLRISLDQFQGLHIPPASMTELRFEKASCTVRPVNYTSKKKQEEKPALGGGDIDPHRA
jgi:probable phosphomutase (TIGR03848 family)